MCEYVTESKCKITNDCCPYVYYCTKINGWRAMDSMRDDCRIKQRFLTPKGSHFVRMVRGKYLYVDIDNHTEKIPNPFDGETPLYVNVTKTKAGYKIKVGSENHVG